MRKTNVKVTYRKTRKYHGENEREIRRKIHHISDRNLVWFELRLFTFGTFRYWIFRCDFYSPQNEPLCLFMAPYLRSYEIEKYFKRRFYCLKCTVLQYIASGRVSIGLYYHANLRVESPPHGTIKWNHGTIKCRRTSKSPSASQTLRSLHALILLKLGSVTFFS